MSAWPRLHTESALSTGARFALSPEQGHRLLAVRRVRPGDPLLLFNQGGEWEASVAAADKRSVTVEVGEQRRPGNAEPGPWLLVAPVKRLKLDLIVEKATELGASLIRPVFTARTVPERVKEERLRSIALSAAEQCERLTIPELAPALPLDQALADWPAERRLLVLDETGNGRPIAAALADLPPGPLALLVGPEGGFTDKELDALRRLSFAVPVGLGPRVLRAETALIAALACTQAIRGDWSPGQ